MSRYVKHHRYINQVEQNHRKSNVEISGIPANVDDGDLKSAVVRIVNFITEGQYTHRDVEASHRLGGRSPKPTIVRMKRNILDDVKANANKLKNVDVALNFPQGTRIYVNDNQSPSMKNLARNARFLKEDGLVEDTWFLNAAVKVKAAGQFHKITHEMDLIRIAPKYENFSFDTSFSSRVLYENPDYMGIARMDRLVGAMSHHQDLKRLLKV